MHLPREVATQALYDEATPPRRAALMSERLRTTVTAN
jgi:hypothetical protein